MVEQPWDPRQLILVSAALVIVLLALAMTRLEGRYRRGSQAFRLMLLTLALIVPTVAFYPVVFQAAWDANHTAPPQLMGQAFHLFTAPNRFGLPAFYTLHVWAWKENPNGAFVNWHPNVSCQAFSNVAPNSSR